MREAEGVVLPHPERSRRDDLIWDLSGVYFRRQRADGVPDSSLRAQHAPSFHQLITSSSCCIVTVQTGYL
jgi:hypothetical protein